MALPSDDGNTKLPILTVPEPFPDISRSAFEAFADIVLSVIVTPSSTAEVFAVTVVNVAAAGVTPPITVPSIVPPSISTFAISILPVPEADNFKFEFVQKLADLVSIISIKSNRQSAILISEVTPLFLKHKNNQEIYEKFLELIILFTKDSPETIESFLKNLKLLKNKMDINEIFNWCMTGIKIGYLSKERRLSYFKLESKESIVWIQRTKNNEIFETYKRKICISI